MTRAKPPPPPLADDLQMLTPAQVREALQISETTFDKLVQTGQLTSLKLLDRSRRIPRSSLVAFINAGVAR